MRNVIVLLIAVLSNQLLTSSAQPLANSLTTSFTLCTGRYIRARYEGRLLLIGATDDNQIDGSVSTNLNDCGTASQGWHYVLTLDPGESRQLDVSYDITGQKSCHSPTLTTCGCQFNVDPSGVLNQVCEQCAFQCDQSQSVVVTVNVIYFTNTSTTNAPTLAPVTTDDHGVTTQHVPTAMPTLAAVPLDYYSSGVYWACNDGGFEIFYENGVVSLAAEDAIVGSMLSECGAHSATRTKHIIATIPNPKLYSAVWIHAEVQYNNYACHASMDLTFDSLKSGNGLIRSCQSGYTSLAMTISASAIDVRGSTYTNNTAIHHTNIDTDTDTLRADSELSVGYVILIIVFVMILIGVSVKYAFEHYKKRNFRQQYQDLSGQKLDELIELSETA